MLKTRKEIKVWLDEYNIRNYAINDDLTVDVEDDVELSGRELLNIPVQFKSVAGFFDCSQNPLISLHGCPQEVHGSFYCVATAITSLDGGPNHVGRRMECFSNQLTSLFDAPDYIGEHFDCSLNRISSLTEYPKKVGGDFYCYDNPIIDIKYFNCDFGGNFVHYKSIIPLLESHYELLDYKTGLEVNLSRRQLNAIMNHTSLSEEMSKKDEKVIQVKKKKI